MEFDSIKHLGVNPDLCKCQLKNVDLWPPKM